MCKFLSFYFFGITLAFVIVTSDGRRTLPLRTLLSESKKICTQRESNARQEMLGRNEINDVVEHDIHRCHHACVWENAGLFSNNTFHLRDMIPTVKEIPHRIERVFARTIIYTCVGHGFEIQDPCEKATAFVNCFNTLNQNKPLQIQKK